MLAVNTMFSHTDDSTLPSSTCDTDSCSSQSFSSSNEQLDQSFDFLNNSWPLRHNPANLDQPSRKVNGYPRRSDLNIVSCNSSNASTLRTRPDSSTPRTRPDSSTPRTRLDQPAARGCSPDASVLYSNSTKHYNPSVSGQHACQEMSDYSDWANGYLQYSPHSTCITDLPRDLADGQTLLYLLEVLLGVSLDPVHVKPALEVQKIENIQTCLDVLARHGIPVQNLSAEDIVEANPKVALVLCKLLKQHFGSTSGSSQGSSGLMSISRRTPSPRTKNRSKSPTAIPPVAYHGTHTLPATTFPVMDIEDVALLDWVGHMTGQVVHDYNSFQDGHILCLLINKLTDGAVPDVVLDYGLPSEKVSLALTFSEEELGVTSDLCPEDVVILNDTSKMSSFLTTLHQVFLEQVEDNEHKMREMNEIARNSRARESQEKEANIDLVRKKEIAPSLRNFGERETSQKSGLPSDLSILHSGIRNSEERSLVLNADKLSPRFPSMAKVESKRHEISKERNLPVENGCLSYLQDSSGQIQRENRWCNNSEDTSYFLEELSNMVSSPTSIRHPFHSTDVSLKNSRNKSSSLRKLDALHCHDEDLMYDLLPKESIFDLENWNYPDTMPHAPKSWQKERENAHFKLSDFRNELQRLKEEFFRLMNMKVLQTPEENSLRMAEKPFPSETFIPEDRELVNILDNIDCSSVDKKATKRTILAEKPVTKTGQTSSCAMPYMNVKNGTLPPYRTWSKYENTEGDRYRYYSPIKTDKNETRNETITTKVHSPEVAVRSPNGIGSVKTSAECRGNRTHDVKQINSDCDKPFVSSPKEMQEFKSRDKDDRKSGVSGQRVSGRHRYGMTALVRLSSKKANAVSDTDN